MTANEKDKFGETMKLVERAKEDIYFAQRDRELMEKLRNQLKKVEDTGTELHCPKCHGLLETYTLQGFTLDRCSDCGGLLHFPFALISLGQQFRSLVGAVFDMT
ncbi:MAG: zf-TFIIB domain-containing protein [Candidatus Binatia bacterium]